MYSYNDFERLFIRYQAEAVPAGENLMKFCLIPQAPYNLFETWQEVSACYHSILSTCKMMGVSSLEYLKKFIKSIVNGSRDYGNLLPTTIGINQNKI